MAKPRIFIGSSVENLRVAYAVQQELDHTCEATVWTQGIFEPSRSTLSSLLTTTKHNDAAVFVFAPNDVIRIRNNTSGAVRDNVILELGLFVGALGLERVFFLIPRETDLHLPTDLLGITPLTYAADRSDGNQRAAVGPACHSIQQSLEKLGFKSAPSVASVPSPSLSDAAAATVLKTWVNEEIFDVLLRAHDPSEIDARLRLPEGTTVRLIDRVMADAPRGLRVAVASSTHLQFTKA